MSDKSPRQASSKKSGKTIKLTESEWTFHWDMISDFSFLLSAIGRDETANCSRPAMINVSIITDPPDICRPFLQ